jgi:hypothetical protein
MFGNSLGTILHGNLRDIKRRVPSMENAKWILVGKYKMDTCFSGGFYITDILCLMA